MTYDEILALRALWRDSLHLSNFAGHLEQGPGTLDAPSTLPPLAATELTIPRPDLGPNCVTVVHQGDRIPVEALPWL